MFAAESEKGSLIASDIIAIGQYSENYFVLPEMTIAKITRDDIEIKDFASNSVCPEILKLDWDINAGTKAAFRFIWKRKYANSLMFCEKQLTHE